MLERQKAWKLICGSNFPFINVLWYLQKMASILFLTLCLCVSVFTFFTGIIFVVTLGDVNYNNSLRFSLGFFKPVST
jgi:hypothetical protein